MPTDPARVRRNDPGDPNNCPVWNLHAVYSDDKTREWAEAGCRSASIGCLDCKAPVIEAVKAELKPIRERAEGFIEQPEVVRTIMAEGTERARDAAVETLDDVRSAMQLDYR